jgi:hypothetical protein
MEQRGMAATEDRKRFTAETLDVRKNPQRLTVVVYI